MRILILGGGPSPGDDDVPAWLAENHGKVLVERLVDACSGLQATLVFAVRQQDIRRHHIDDIVRLAAPTAVVVPIDGETMGAACTALLCIRWIDAEDELLILNGNEFLDIDYKEIIDELRQRRLDGGMVTFHSVHPRYSYVALDESGLIIEAAEKRPISRHATAGFYWFRRGEDFLQAAKDMISKDVQVDGRFYISLTFNELILKQSRLGVHQVDARRYRPLKSQRQISAYEFDERENQL